LRAAVHGHRLLGHAGRDPAGAWHLLLWQVLPPVLTGPAHMHTRTCTAATGGCAWSLCGSAWSCLRRGVFACVPQRALLPGRQTRITAACRPAVCPCVQPYAPVAVSGSGGRPRQEAGSQVPVVAARASPPGARRAGLGWQHHPGAQGGLCGRAARCAGAAGTGCTPVTRPDTSAQKQRQAGCVFTGEGAGVWLPS